MALKVRWVGALAAAACLVAPAAAQAACPVTPQAQTFAQFGDLAQYTIAPGGGFEAGDPAWTMSGASVGSGNEPWLLRAATDSRSAVLSGRGSVTSPVICVGAEHPTMRFTARQLNAGKRSELRVELLYGPTKSPTAVLAGAVQGDGATGWRVSAPMRMATALPLNTSADGTMQVRIRMSVADLGSWAVDDVFIDPYRA